MQLFINNREVYLEEELRPNLTLQWLDTFNPSAIKTDYSKTISIPDCIQNAGLFQSTTNNTWTLWDNGEVIQKGYLTVDDITESGGLKHYNVTLYGELNNFFYNLKGDDNNTKKLSDLQFGFTGYTSEEEKGKIIEWNVNNVYTGWSRLWNGSPAGSGVKSSGSVYDTFVAIPASMDYKDLKKDKTLFELTDNRFPTASIENPDAKVWVDENGKKCSILQHSDSNMFIRGDFRTDMMPIGIRYRDIIKACCNPVNNGGYTVELDPTFFNESNPYYNDLFLCVKQPDQEYSPGINISSQPLNGGVGVDVGSSTTSTSNITVRVGSDPGWSNSGSYIVATPGLSQTNISFNIVPATQPAQSYVQDNDDYMELNNASYWIDIIDPNTGRIIKSLDRSLSGYCKLEPVRGKPYYELRWVKAGLYQYDPEESCVLDETVVLDGEYTELQIRLTLSNPRGTMNIYHLWDQSLRGQGDSVAIGMTDSDTIKSYFTEGSSFIYNNNYSIKDLTNDLGSPFDYLTWYTKMFNLRFQVDSAHKIVRIIQGKNWVNTTDIKDLTGKIDYDQNYVTKPRVVDEKYIEFKLDYDENETLKGMTQNSKPFSYTYTANNLRYSNSTKDYLSGVKLKIGYTDTFVLIDSNKYVSPNYPLTNQVDGIGIGYITTNNLYFQDSTAGVVYDDYSGSFGTQRFYRKDYTSLKDVTNDILLYSPYRTSTEGPEVEADGFDVRTISTTSQDMLVFAEGPCFIQGRGKSIYNTPNILNCRTKSFKTSEMSVPCFLSYDPYTKKELGYSKTVTTVSCSNMYEYFSDFMKRIYADPEIVECYVRFEDIPSLRSLYYFENQYWALTKVEDYNYKDEPVRCTFVKYNINA